MFDAHSGDAFVEYRPGWGGFVYIGSDGLVDVTYVYDEVLRSRLVYIYGLISRVGEQRLLCDDGSGVLCIMIGVGETGKEGDL